MSTSRYSLVIFAILCLALQVSVASNEISKNLYFPNNTLVFDSHSYYKTASTLALCDKSKEQSEKSCEVVFGFFSGINTFHKCNVTLKAENDNWIIGRFVRIVPLGRAGSILIWVEKPQESASTAPGDPDPRDYREAYLRFTNVLEHCQTSQLKIPIYGWNANVDLAVREVAVVSYSDRTYDVVYKNSTLCGEKLCKLTYDVGKGEQVTGAIPWIVDRGFNVDVIVKPIDAQLEAVRSKGNLVIQQNANGAQVALVQANVTKILKNYVAEGFWHTAHSTDYKYVGVCLSVNSTVSCAQFDSTDATKPPLEVKLQLDYTSNYMFMHNLKDGGFLLLTTQLLDVHRRDKNNHYYITKVDAAGKTVGRFEVEGFKCDLGENAVTGMMLDNDSKEHCVLLVCYEDGDISGPKVERGHLDFAGRCFTDVDFK